MNGSGSLGPPSAQRPQLGGGRAVGRAHLFEDAVLLPVRGHILVEGQDTRGGQLLHALIHYPLIECKAAPRFSCQCAPASRRPGHRNPWSQACRQVRLERSHSGYRRP